VDACIDTLAIKDRGWRERQIGYLLRLRHRREQTGQPLQIRTEWHQRRDCSNSQCAVRIRRNPCFLCTGWWKNDQGRRIPAQGWRHGAICPAASACYNRFVRWRRAGVWSRIMDALAAAHDAGVQMIDTSIVRVHQHGACIARNRRQPMGRSRGGLTSKIHAVVIAAACLSGSRSQRVRHTTIGLPPNCCPA
jgi:hypothetical protein